MSIIVLWILLAQFVLLSGISLELAAKVGMMLDFVESGRSLRHVHRVFDEVTEVEFFFLSVVAYLIGNKHVHV